MLPSVLSCELVHVDGQHTGYMVNILSLGSRFFGCWEFDFEEKGHTMIDAHVITRHYGSGQAFYTVECESCNVMLNSGHHYTELQYAERTMNNHNEEKHN